MVLPAHDRAGEVNAIAFGGLLVLQYAGARIGLAPPQRPVGPTATAA
jgi:hypothetical protein